MVLRPGDVAPREPTAPGTGSTRVVTQEVVSGGSSRVVAKSPEKRERTEAADESGLRGAFLAYGGEMLGFALRSSHSRERAEDAVQETFARAWRSRSRFDSSLGSLRTWLFSIERRVIVDFHAVEIKSRATSYGPREDVAGKDHVENAMLGWLMESALARLDAEHRMVITEIYFNGRSGKEVAELFGLPEGTVRSRAFYALRMLRLLLEEVGWDQ